MINPESHILGPKFSVVSVTFHSQSILVFLPPSWYYSVVNRPTLTVPLSSHLSSRFQSSDPLRNGNGTGTVLKYILVKTVTPSTPPSLVSQNIYKSSSTNSRDRPMREILKPKPPENHGDLDSDLSSQRSTPGGFPSRNVLTVNLGQSLH